MRALSGEFKGLNKNKVIHTKLFEKLKNFGIDNKLINTIRLIYSYVK